MNKIWLLGRLTRDPELRYTQNGAAVCTFTLAVNRPVNPQGEREADFIDIVAWNKMAENIAKYMTKGRQLSVEGRLQIRSWEGTDSQRHWRTEVIASAAEFIGGGDNQQRQAEERPARANDAAPSASAPTPHGDFGREVSFDDEDLPF